MERKDYIWLFGENNSLTCNNNSFYFWEQVVNNEDGIQKYFILQKNKYNKKAIKNIEKSKRKNIVWKNSIKHYLLYRNADMFLVTVSYKDVSPDKILWKNIKPHPIKPVIYLQHGTIGMKRIGYTGKYYNNNMFRFFMYNKKIIEQYRKENDFKSYQLYYAKYHARYKELVRKNEEFLKNKKQKQILWFLTWREYLGPNKETSNLIKNIKYIVNDPKLNKFLKENNYKFKICVHQFFDTSIIANIMKKDNENIEIAYQKNVNVMDELIQSDILITDYSSVGFDFTFLNKPVILYQPDLKAYLKNRSFYCSMKELSNYSILNKDDLINEIVKGEYKINEFFRQGLPEDIDYEYVKQGKHIDDMYKYLKEIQENKITFIGYNFYGIGGTVSATKALAEALMEKNYMVELISLKKTKSEKLQMPYGLNVRALYIHGSKKKKELVKRLLRSKKSLRYLNDDKNRNNLIPYVGYALEKILKNIKSTTVVSTRESLHMFLKNAKSKNIKNKLYFFHTDATVLKSSFPKVVEHLKNEQLENAIFVTESSRENYKKVNNYENYENSAIIGNTLASYSVLSKEQLSKMKLDNKKSKLKGILLMRISIDRKKDVNNIIEFGKYLKENKKNNIVINVYGKGDYLEEFEKLVDENQISKYIKYKGSLENPQDEILNSNFVLDLSENQSFGMIYLEAIFNGKMVFCKRNVGSNEILRDIPEAYFSSYEELANKIAGIPEITKEQLIRNYELLYDRYSREKVAEKFIKLLK